ncbi:hypothetical protein F4781DRAFT_441237 [Annulohypoxylon bovei var. microspora]|nr:hypothetical protein F4781DRAFT_441237 [Annulohypoxylon bovei var. microspora]
MRFNVSAVLLAVHAGCILAATNAHQLAASECGDLGIMEYDESTLPQGVKPSDVRKCAQHPLGHSRVKGEGSLAPESDTVLEDVNYDNATILQPRDCQYDAKYGCTNGYCWKACGQPGQWCWAAKGDGTGPWIQCASYKDCKTKYACGKGCGKECGCGC